MSLILVVEKDAGFANRIASTLRPHGYSIDSVDSCEAGLQHAALRPPSLVLVSGVLPGAADLLGRYSASRGGPGSIVLVPAAMADQMVADQFGADHLLPNPVPEAELLQLTQRRAPALPAGPPDPSMLPNVGAQLTSEEIFGDVLAEVEADANERMTTPQLGTPAQSPAGPPRSFSLPSQAKPAASAGTPKAPQPPSQAPAPQTPHLVPPPQAPALQSSAPRAAQAPATTEPVSRTPIAQNPSAPSSVAPTAEGKPIKRSNDDIDRKLEETLSGFFPDKLRKPAKEQAKAKPKRAPVPSADEIDDLLDKTLSSLEIPSLAKKQQRKEPTERPVPEAPAKAPTPAAAPPSFAPPTNTAPAPKPKPLTSPSSADRAAPYPPKVSPKAPSPPPNLDLQSPAETIRLEKPPFVDTEQGWSPSPPAPPSAPEPARSEAASPFPTAAAPPAPSFEEELPAPPDLDIPIEATGTFDLPSIEPLPAADIWDNASSFAPEPEVPEASEEPSAPSFSSFAQPDPPAPKTPDLDPPLDSATGGWSVSSFEALDASAPLEVTPPPPKPSAPSSFTLHDEEPPPASSEYPTDFTNAFSLPESDEQEQAPDEAIFSPSAFSPDPTETIDPEDTEGLQRTLDNVLQIRDGAAPVSKKSGEPFGDYRLLERVAVGGMAEVWRAQRRGVEGFQKTVAIKKILSHLTGSHDFVTMFIDEAKLAAQLNHANIIQIYDLGKVDDDFFIAMEFVDGKDLRSIQNRLKDLNEKLPLGLCLLCVAALARALDYAHRKRDFDNTALGLVHRDVSPQNVLISYEGEIKLCDFGIVKAVAKASTTQMGALKGKLQYMSPEQAWGKEVDARSDIFSLGSVLFETLTGERLFTGDSEIGVLDAVRDCRIRSPRSLDPSIPPDVDAIVMKALAKTPETRYQTAGELERDIATVLENLRPAVGQGEVAALMERLFGPRLLAKSEAENPPLLEEPLTPPSPSQIIEPMAPPAKAPEEKKGGSRTWLVAAIILFVLAAVVVMLVMSLGGDSSDSAAEQPAATTPSTAPPTAITPPSDETAVVEGASGSEGEANQDASGAEPNASGDSGADSPNPETEPASSEPAATAPETDGQQTDGEEEGPDQVQKLVQEALDSEKQRMAEDFEAKRRQLEAELAKVQQATEESDDGGDESGGGGDG